MPDDNIPILPGTIYDQIINSTLTYSNNNFTRFILNTTKSFSSKTATVNLANNYANNSFQIKLNLLLISLFYSIFHYK